MKDASNGKKATQADRLQVQQYAHSMMLALQARNKSASDEFRRTTVTKKASRPPLRVCNTRCSPPVTRKRRRLPRPMSSHGELSRQINRRHGVRQLLHTGHTGELPRERCDQGLAGGFGSDEAGCEVGTLRAAELRLWSESAARHSREFSLIFDVELLSAEAAEEHPRPARRPGNDTARGAAAATPRPLFR